MYNMQATIQYDNTDDGYGQYIDLDHYTYNYTTNKKIKTNETLNDYNREYNDYNREYNEYLDRCEHSLEYGHPTDVPSPTLPVYMNHNEIVPIESIDITLFTRPVLCLVANLLGLIKWIKR